MDSHKPDAILAHTAALRRYARALTRDPTAADDLVQDTLLVAHEKRSELSPARSIRAWLFSVLHNRFIDGVRRRKRETERLETMAERSVAPPSSSPELGAYLRQIAERFDALPEGQRTVLHLIAVEGLGYQETADTLGIPVGTVMSRLNRARTTLRQEEAAPGRARLRIVGARDDD